MELEEANEDRSQENGTEECEDKVNVGERKKGNRASVKPVGN